MTNIASKYPRPLPLSRKRARGVSLVISRRGLAVLDAACIALVLGLLVVPAQAKTMLRDICRVKGQEENTLQGLGIVVGLKGTGDGGSFVPTIRSMAMAMEMMGSPIGSGGAKELKDTKNVALVVVTATVPAGGARQGDKIDCVVSSIGSAKSLAGGRLYLTPLLGPVPGDSRVYAIASGPLTLDSAETPTTGRVHGGCRLEEEFSSPFVREGKITLVLTKDFADFQVAQEVTELLNGSDLTFQNNNRALARALDQVNVEVQIPQQYLDDPVSFVSQVLRQEMIDPPTGARVVINERAGSIVISGDVEIGPVVVSHKNIVVETTTAGTAPTTGRFVPIDPQDAQNPTLKSLVQALNAVNVPTEDIIEIIKGLERDGKLHGRLILQ